MAKFQNAARCDKDDVVSGFKHELAPLVTETSFTHTTWRRRCLELLVSSLLMTEGPTHC